MSGSSELVFTSHRRRLQGGPSIPSGRTQSNLMMLVIFLTGIVHI